MEVQSCLFFYRVSAESYCPATVAELSLWDGDQWENLKILTSGPLGTIFSS